ncbi:hypothetical protein FGADI_12062 [Fusarium gaditjirri]|uniref:Uncharacterized protein n=1 Tax=Fusarium gaditjirri TaxID=282569 RepID=A0A8H4SSY3_9HYPO|nr:hypothetical protein FGADI_12062 [Fusarium gaditjirri]
MFSFSLRGSYEDDEEDQRNDSNDNVTRQTRYTHQSRSDTEGTGNPPIVDTPFTFEPSNGLNELRQMLHRQQSEINELKMRQEKDITTLRGNVLQNGRRLDGMSSAFASTLSKLERSLDRHSNLLYFNTRASLEVFTKLGVKEVARMAVEDALDMFPLNQKIKDAVVAQFEMERPRSVWT